MRKVIILGTVMLTMCISLTGCHIKHEWVEATCTEPKTCTIGGETEGEPLGHTWVNATCTEPKTCSVCGETEGEALGHTWAEATCTEPKTCSVCGEKEGEALGHTWVDANYQEPKTCSVCGETEGEPLTPSFETHGLVINMEEGVTYDYLTICYDNPSKETVGHLTISNYQISEALEGYETPEGYEWRSVHASILFDDDNAWNYGMSVGICRENYYDIEGWDNSSQYDEARELSTYTVNYHGVDYPECAVAVSGGFSGWVDQTNTYELDYSVRVPVGYDGFVIGFYNKRTQWEDGMYIYDVADENTMFFRLN